MTSTLATGKKRADFVDALAVYFKRPVLIVMLLGFSSGLPLALSGTTLAVWMTERGVDLKTIGLFALVGLPYTIKFLWAPSSTRSIFPCSRAGSGGGAAGSSFRNCC